MSTLTSLVSGGGGLKSSADSNSKSGDASSGSAAGSVFTIGGINLGTQTAPQSVTGAGTGSAFTGSSFLLPVLIAALAVGAWVLLRRR